MPSVADGRITTRGSLRLPQCAHQMMATSRSCVFVMYSVRNNFAERTVGCLLCLLFLQKGTLTVVGFRAPRCYCLKMKFQPSRSKFPSRSEEPMLSTNHAP